MRKVTAHTGPVTATIVVLVVTAAALVVLARALGGQQDDSLIPVLPSPPAVDPRYLVPIDGEVTTTVADVAFRTSLGHRVRVPRVEVVAHAASLGADAVRASLIRITGLEVIAPPDTITTGFDAFIEFPVPRLQVDRLVLEDAFIGALAHPTQYEGRWLWWQDDIDVDVRDLRLGGDGPEGLRLVHAAFAGERRDRPLRLAAASGTVTRFANRLDGRIVADMGESTIAVNGVLQRSGAFDARATAEPLVFAEARAILLQLPAVGSATADVRLTGEGGGVTIEVERALAEVLSSRLTASGSIHTGDGGAFDELRIDIPVLATADVDSVFGVWLPGDIWSGSILADGPVEGGVTVSGNFAGNGGAAATAGNGNVSGSRISFGGSIRAGPHAAVTFGVEAERIPVDEGFADARIEATGRPDSLAIAGSVRTGRTGRVAAADAELRGLVEELSDGSRRADATVELRALMSDDAGTDADTVGAIATGYATLAADRRIDARVVADSLPLALLPLPEAVDSVRGEADIELRLSGALGDPDANGTVVLRDGEFYLRPVRLHVREVSGSVPIEEGTARFDGVAARAGGGVIGLRGSVALLGEERTADVALSAEGVGFSIEERVRVVASGSVTATGPLDAATVDGSMRFALPPERGGGEVAIARGSANLKTRALELSIRADSFPLDVLPETDQLRAVHGAVRAAIDVRGTLDEPDASGTIVLEDAGMHVVRTGTDVRGLRGAATMRGGRITIDSVVGMLGEGRLTADGELRVRDEPRTLALNVALDSGLVVSTDSAQVTASAALQVAGRLERPHVEGTVRLIEGWVHEDNFARTPAIDTLAPPYHELVQRVPWLENSRLRQRTADASAALREPAARPRPAVEAAEGERPVMPDERRAPLTANVTIRIEPGLRLIDEDSELYGTGQVSIVVDSAGGRAEGIHRVTGGYYAQYGEVFDVKGGAFAFRGSAAPDVSMRSEHRIQTPLGSWLSETPHLLDGFPPLEFLAIGTTAAVTEEVRRLALLPESRTELAALLLYGERVQPVTGWRTRTFWPPEDGAGPFGESSGTRSTVLLWSYISNESYDYLPLDVAYLRGGTIEAGPDWPGPITVGRFVQGGLLFGPLNTILTQPLEGGTAPGVRLGYGIGAYELLAFSEPRFRSAAPALPAGRVFTVGRRTGVGVRWSWEW